MSFCVPAQQILKAYSRRVDRQVVFDQMLQGTKADGVPDFVFQISRMWRVRGKTVKTWVDLVVGEGKTPSVMGSVLRVVAQQLQEDVRASCMQTCDYVRLRLMRYGFLTYLDGTFFIKRLGNDVYAFTDALPPDAQNPTITEMLLYIAPKQHEEGPWQDIPAGDQSAAQASQQATVRVQNSIGSSSTSSLITEPSHPEEALDYADEILGSGQTGNVVLARFYGQPAAIKSLDLSKQDHLVGRLQNEVEIYDHLQDLQGACIPRLLGHGLWHNDTTLFMATSVIQGYHPSYEGNPPQVLTTIEQVSELQSPLEGGLRPLNVSCSAATVLRVRAQQGS
eukprot:GHUV01037453.1.p1 GENE.GHUV01037453.1~~GHUV01037453.1.p1  ORF type:complete len:336 (+),score=75.47 GHUV01037453.1:491-1498(+)